MANIVPVDGPKVTALLRLDVEGFKAIPVVWLGPVHYNVGAVVATVFRNGILQCQGPVALLQHIPGLLASSIHSKYNRDLLYIQRKDSSFRGPPRISKEFLL